jgi:D-alanine-D-alanine ligase
LLFVSDIKYKYAVYLALNHSFMARKNLAVIIGGKSPEHAISLRSGRSVIQALNKARYNIYVIGINKQGTWFLQDTHNFLDHEDDTTKIALKPSSTEVYLHTDGKRAFLIERKGNRKITNLDVAFPVLHGAFGEDGVIQGIFRSVNLAFVGVDVLASAAGMDKDIAKRLWRDSGIPVADFVTLTPETRKNYTFEIVSAKLGLPLFVKPANAGSSVGVHKVLSAKDYEAALDDSFLYDRKILVEEAISGIEVEVAILGNENPKASVVGAIVPTEDFYSFEAKYISTTGAKLMIPAPVDAKIGKKIQKTAIRAFQCIGAEGLSRVDFFMREDGSIVLNEINTLPGFTSISMYPKLWEASGLPYSDLLDKLIQLGIKRHQKMKQIKTTW